MLSFNNKRQVNATKSEVAEYLSEVKDIINDNKANYRTYHIEPRAKNKRCILQLGLNYRLVIGEILQLNVEDYYEGPVPDKDIKSDIWVFGTPINGKEVYIKLKKVVIGDLRQVRIISFHFSEWQLIYPHK